MKIAISFIFIVFCFSTFSHAQKTKVISQDWTSFVQTINVTSITKKKFKLTASVKVDTNDKSAWAGLWVRTDTKDGENGFFDNMQDRPVKTNDWKTYTIEGTIDSNTQKLNFGGLCLYNGDFYFDDFQLLIENNKGKFIQYDIANSSFEQKIIDNKLLKWNESISDNQNKRVKEYTLTTSNDAAKGKHSLLITGSGIKQPLPRGVIGTIEGVSPEIGSMISMLEDLKSRVEYTVKNLSQYQIDHLHDEKANRIGALIMHLAAAEVNYQVITFEGRTFNEEEEKKWGAALHLDKEGRDEFVNHEISYYLTIFNKVREKTILELKKRDDKWLKKIQPAYGFSNHYSWFHVMEHQSSHLGQILFLKKRIPPEEPKKKKLSLEIKN